MLAMPSKVAFSKRHSEIGKLALYHEDVERSLRLYFSPDAQSYSVRFAGYSKVEVNRELNERLAELELASALSALSAIEAAFRIDYLQRCYLRKKDPLSRAFRRLHKEKEMKVSLEDEIFEIWKEYATGASPLIGNLRGAFKFRHWLAHGRYWVPKFPKYDYLTIYTLAESALNSLPLLALES
jgi:hypothetical protein